MASWGLSQTLGAEVAPEGIPPFQCPCACSPSAFCTRISGTAPCAKLFLTVKDGEGGDWSGRGSGAASAWEQRQALRAARRGPPAEILTLRAADLQSDSSRGALPPGPPGAASAGWTAPSTQAPAPNAFHSLWDARVLPDLLSNS